MYAHVLIVGGTGMLREASQSLSTQARRITSVAHTHQSLATLDAGLPARHGVHHMLALDWSSPDDFIQKIVEHIKRTEQPDLVLAWTHSETLAIRLATALGNGHVEFFHVVGSSRTNPAQIAEQANSAVGSLAGLTYFQVILGAKRHGSSFRWLTNNEISAGVLAAIQERQSRFVVGTLERW